MRPIVASNENAVIFPEPPISQTSTRRNFLQVLAASAAAGAVLPAAADAPLPVGQGVLNVRDFGAVGDGKADDTDAFHKALAAAAKLHSGRTVVVPGGSYRLTSPLDLKSTLLLGQSAGGWPADSRPLPTLLVDVPAPEACIIAYAGASVHGLSLAFATKGEPKREFGPAVLIKGGGVSLTNLAILNPTEGIMWDGSTNIGRLNIENVFIVNARKCGLYVAYTMDISTLRNIEVWNYEPGLVNSCTGFKLGQNDEIRLSNCVVYSAAIGFHFIETRYPNSGKMGAMWGGLENCTVDFFATRVRIDAATSLRVQGGSIWAHHNAVQLFGRGDVVINGTDVRANAQHGIHVKECDSVTVTGCLFKKNGTAWPDAAKILIEGGKSVLVNGCTFDDTSVGISIRPGANNFSVTGNVFPKMAHPAIVDHSAANARKLVAANLAG
jgi:polygalacturonase